VAEIIVPELAESITEGTISRWIKQPGETIERGEFIVELETDKVNVEIISEEAGIVQEHLAAEGDTVDVGQVIAIVGEGSGAPAASTPKEEAAATPAPEKAVETPTTETGAEDRTLASPAARKLAREKGIDLAAINPVDPMGRIKVQDVEAHSSVPKAQPSAPASKEVAADDGRKEHLIWIIQHMRQHV